MSVNYTIGTLSTLTGLSQHTIRAWERRYNALAPNRTDTNRRLYTQVDVERLSLLRRIIEAGHSVGQVAHLPTDELRALDSKSGVSAPAAIPRSAEGPKPYLAAFLDSLDRLDQNGLEEALLRGAAAIGVFDLLVDVIIPVLATIEHGWTDGSIPISKEHLASSVISSYLNGVRTSLRPGRNAPKIVITTPAREQHELGALMVAVTAAISQWDVIYLGPNLPVRDIAEAVRISGAGAVGLSIVCQKSEQDLPGQLRLLRELVGPEIRLLLGGRAALHYSEVIAEIDAEAVTDLRQFRQIMETRPAARPQLAGSRF